VSSSACLNISIANAVDVGYPGPTLDGPVNALAVDIWNDAAMVLSCSLVKFNNVCIIK